MTEKIFKCVKVLLICYCALYCLRFMQLNFSGSRLIAAQYLPYALLVEDYELMLYNKERKFRTPRWNNQAAVVNPGLRGSSSPVTYPSFARVFRAGATRLHFIPAHAGISYTRSVDFIACLGVGIAEDGSRERGDWVPLHQQRYCRCGVRLFHCAPWENKNAVSMLYISQ